MPQAHLKSDGILIVEVGGLRADIETKYPRMPFTWLTTSQGDDMVFLLKKSDFERLVPRAATGASAATSDDKGARDSAPFSAALSAIASGAGDVALQQALDGMQAKTTKTAAKRKL